MKTLTCPPELLAVVEAEKRRVAQTAANIEACSVAINSVEAALATLATGSQNNFVVSLKVYLRSAIAHFLRSGTAATPPTFPPRPTGPPPAVPIIKNAAKSVLPAKFHTSQAAQNKAAGLRQNVPTQRSSKNLPNYAAPSKLNERLFLRIDKDHKWLLLAPSGVREIFCEHLNCIPYDMTYVTRTPIGFALTIKEKEIRQKLLNDSDRISSQGAKLEPASDLTTYRIATVPVALRTSSGSVTVDYTNLVAEIIRVTNVAPKMVGVHSKTRSGAPQCSWLAHFSREQAPRPGFRLFDESGVRAEAAAICAEAAEISAERLPSTDQNIVQVIIPKIEAVMTEALAEGDTIVEPQL
ncbi:putative eka-like protein [Erysiphe necator]|uniref:Putative eka-like protein n=1 Tax=Uncinula necator TaxID=52586 RepID=A0A0B1PC01_UNCNE|nr:putative eka-like protein [Erysiphe necator]